MTEHDYYQNCFIFMLFGYVLLTWIVDTIKYILVMKCEKQKDQSK